MTRPLALAAALALLSACDAADDRAPFVESRTPPGLAARFFPPPGWTWGLVQTGEKPPQRYGVASPPVAPRGHVLVLPGYGESAEAWFETAADLGELGFTVWVLEGAGQGGSGRYAPRRDLGHVPDFAADVAAVRAMVETVIRPGPDERLVLLAHGEAAVTALRAAQTGLAVHGLVAAGPRLAPEDGAAGRSFLAGPLDAVPSPGWRAWRREAPPPNPADDPYRAKVQHAWQTANPDLRMAGPSRGWRAAFGEATRAVEANAARADLPVLMTVAQTADPAAAGLCRRLPACRLEPIPGAEGPPHLAPDPAREAWLAAVGAFIAEQVQ